MYPTGRFRKQVVSWQGTLGLIENANDSWHMSDRNLLARGNMIFSEEKLDDSYNNDDFVQKWQVQTMNK
jgi:hypothetical protein